MAPPIQCGGSRHWPNKIKTQQRNKKIFDKNKQTPVFGRVLIIRIPKSPENHNSSIDYTFFFVSCVVVVIHNGKNALASSNRCQLKVLQVPTQYRHTKKNARLEFTRGKRPGSLHRDAEVSALSRPKTVKLPLQGEYTIYSCADGPITWWTMMLAPAAESIITTTTTKPKKQQQPDCIVHRLVFFLFLSSSSMLSLFLVRIHQIDSASHIDFDYISISIRYVFGFNGCHSKLKRNICSPIAYHKRFVLRIYFFFIFIFD